MAVGAMENAGHLQLVKLSLGLRKPCRIKPPSLGKDWRPGCLSVVDDAVMRRMGEEVGGKKSGITSQQVVDFRRNRLQCGQH